jgi:hypothetical protein
MGFLGFYVTNLENVFFDFWFIVAWVGAILCNFCGLWFSVCMKVVVCLIFFLCMTVDFKHQVLCLFECVASPASYCCIYHRNVNSIGC